MREIGRGAEQAVGEAGRSHSRTPPAISSTLLPAVALRTRSLTSVTIARTRSSPASAGDFQGGIFIDADIENACVGLRSVEVWPSPKRHSHDVGVPLDVSVGLGRSWHEAAH